MNILPKKKFFNKSQEKTIIESIQNAEKNTSGEIRVHVESKAKKDEVFERALEVFAELEMHKTQQRNGVLFYLASQEKRFAVVADEGINKVVEENFWNKISEVLETHFKESKFEEGLSKGILMAGEALKEFFPYQSDDKNELPDDISTGE